ncbi:helix-turn-helix transcriptional regulator [Pedobacter miscanthi]|nr:helix-turn-helix transcriptional regulator [Pedobacter miscanthi]
MANETFHFQAPRDIVAWQFNRDFYCIVDHDKEVSCMGFLFFGSSEKMFIALDSKDQSKAEMTLQLFQDEFETSDHIQGEMMQVLLKRLIIIITRLGKQQYLQQKEDVGDKIDIIRNYNYLVENNFRKEHQVKFYADKLNKSPKTLSNLFALNSYKSPVLLIQERIFLEAKRLFFYTEKTSKEIAYELGFENANHFSKFFRKHANVSPTEFRKLSPVGAEV